MILVVSLLFSQFILSFVNGRVDIPDLESNYQQRFSRDDFIYNEPNNATFYIDIPRFNDNNNNNNNGNINHTRISRALDLDHLLGGPRVKQNTGNRESRILNDKDNYKPSFSLQGFIPIISLTNNKQTQNSESKPQKVESYAGPNDAKYFSSLVYNSFAKPQRIQSGPENEQDCICVPFYMCKKGFIEQRTRVYNSESIQDSIDSAQSALNKFSIPSQLAELYQQQYDQSEQQKLKPLQEFQSSSSQQDSTKIIDLPLDERTINSFRDDPNNSNISSEIAPPYASDVLGRMFSNNNGHNCGVLRTCCKILQEFHNNEYSNSHSHLHPNPLPHHQHHHNINTVNLQHHESQFQPNLGQAFSSIYHPFYNDKSQYSRPAQKRPTFGFDLSTSLIRPKPHPLNGLFGQSFTSSKPLSHQMFPIQPPRHTRPPVPNYTLQPLKTQAMETQAHIVGSCGIRNAVGIHGRIQNLQYHKTSTEFSEYPWQAAILKRLGPADNLYVCGGTLISNQWVATAAHCIKKNGPQDLKVRLGEWDVHRDDEFYPHIEKYVQEIIVHPEFYSGNLINDIALLKLDAPLDFSLPHIAPACIPSHYENFAGHRCWVTGWGKDSFGHQGEYQSVLKEVDLPIHGNGECEQTLRHTRLGPSFQLHPGFLCAGGEPGKDACEGDGGSPLVCDVKGIWKVVGLVSWGIGCGQPGVPGVYVNMGYYSQWINNIISNVAKNPNVEYIPEPYTSIISERSNDAKLRSSNELNTTIESNITNTVNATTELSTTVKLN